MSTIKDGGPAFPSPPYDLGGGIETLPVHGMSLRDYFAGQALVGMMQAMRPYSDELERSARSAYAQADAMLAARDAKP